MLFSILSENSCLCRIGNAPSVSLEASSFQARCTAHLWPRVLTPPLTQRVFPQLAVCKCPPQAEARSWEFHPGLLHGCRAQALGPAISSTTGWKWSSHRSGRWLSAPAAMSPCQAPFPLQVSWTPVPATAWAESSGLTLRQAGTRGAPTSGHQ